MSDGTIPTERSGKSSRGCLGALIAVLLLPILVYSTIKYLQRPDHKPTFHAQVTVDVEVNGMPVHIERVITCQTFATGDNIQISLRNFWKTLTSRRETQWISIPRAFGEVLPDGSALMIRTPYFCGRESFRDSDGKKRLKVQDWKLPRVSMIGWSPDAAKIDTLELYISETAFHAEDAKVQNVQMDVKLVEGATPSKPDDFAWFSGLYHPQKWQGGPTDEGEFSRAELTKGDGSVANARFANFITYAGWILSPEDWKGKDQSLDNLLSSIKEPTVLQDNLSIIDRLIMQQRLGGLTSNGIISQQAWRGLNSNKLGWDNPEKSSSVYGHEGRNTIFDFQLQDGNVLLDRPARQGVLSLERVVYRPEKATADTSAKGRPILLSGTVLMSRQAPVNVVFDPATQRIFSVRLLSLQPLVPPDHFLLVE